MGTCPRAVPFAITRLSGAQRSECINLGSYLFLLLRKMSRLAAWLMGRTRPIQFVPRSRSSGSLATAASISSSVIAAARAQSERLGRRFISSVLVLVTVDFFTIFAVLISSLLVAMLARLLEQSPDTSLYSQHSCHTRKGILRRRSYAHRQ
jgi:hypothetical protein